MSSYSLEGSCFQVCPPSGSHVWGFQRESSIKSFCCIAPVFNDFWPCISLSLPPSLSSSVSLFLALDFPHRPQTFKILTRIKNMSFKNGLTDVSCLMCSNLSENMCSNVYFWIWVLWIGRLPNASHILVTTTLRGGKSIQPLCLGKSTCSKQYFCKSKSTDSTPVLKLNKD